MSKLENTLRYFTPEDVKFMLSNKFENTTNVWSEFYKMSEDDQAKVFQDRKILEKLTFNVNRIRTTKLLEASYYLKNGERIGDYFENDTRLRDFFVDLEKAFENLQARERELLILYYIYQYSQTEIEMILIEKSKKKKVKKISQRWVSEIIKTALNKLTQQLIDR